jgi:uncharacterized protein YegL
MEFADNPEPRCPCVLLLDTSQSMKGDRINALNHGLSVFRDEVMKDSLAQLRVEVAIISFGRNVELVQPFVTVDRFTPPVLQAHGQTPMGTGILMALNYLEKRKQEYRQSGITYYRPWLFMITDGAPQGEDMEVTRQAVDRVKAEDTAKKVAFFAVGVEGANMKFLSKISLRQPLKLVGLNFAQMFVWLSRSVEKVAHSREGEQVPLDPPVGWGAV